MSTVVLIDGEIKDEVQDAIKTIACVAIAYGTKEFSSTIEMEDSQDGSVRKFEVVVKEIE